MGVKRSKNKKNLVTMRNTLIGRLYSKFRDKEFIIVNIGKSIFDNIFSDDQKNE